MFEALNQKSLAVPFALLALATLAACSDGGAQNGPMQMPPPQVNVLTANPQAVPVSFEYVGQTLGSREVEVRARVSGILEKRAFTEGGPVKAGQTLFQIDPKPLQAQAAAAEADVATAEAKLAQASREAARIKPLAEDKAISQKEYDDAVSGEQVAVAALKAAKARLQEIRLNLGYTRVDAPVTGISGRAVKSEGSLVGPGADGLLTTILQVDPLYVSFSAADTERSRFERDVASGQLKLPANGKLALSLRQKDGELIAQGGYVNFVSTSVSGQTGTVEMRGELPNPGGKVRAGQFVTVVLEGAQRANALVVPQRAVLESPQGKILMLAAKNKEGQTVVEPRPIQVGEWVKLPGESSAEGKSNLGWVVTAGLKPGDQVILDNFPKLRPGAPVQVLAPAAPAAQSAPAAQAAPAVTVAKK